MPALYDLLARSTDGASSAAVVNNSSTTPPLDVVCAWPLSSQYGAGSRFLYYVLVATCVLLRKAEWLRKACLAAALLVPSLGALHGIVLACYHVNGAVDLDIFGAWQLCAIAIIAVPTTLRISGTYFNSAGRNLIFLWTILLLSGLIALCVEFSRVTATDCSHFVVNGTTLTANDFPYGQTTCGLTCSEDVGPFSPMRGGSANNIYVVPVPDVLSFNAAMLIAAGVCIPAILSCIFTWDKILQSIWYRTRQSDGEQPRQAEQHEKSDAIRLTEGEIKGINNTVTRFLSVIEIPLFGGIIMAILIAGEINFFSPQLMYMTEPMASIGQWSPIAGTCMAALGSLFVYSSEDENLFEKTGNKNSPKPSSLHSDQSDSPPCTGGSMDEPRSPTHELSGMIHRVSNDGNVLHTVFTITGADGEQTTQHIEDVGNTAENATNKSTAGRSRIRSWFEKVTVSMSETAHDQLDTQGHKNKKAYRYPMSPGEELKNERFYQTDEEYTERRLQRVASSASSIRSLKSNGEGPSTTPVPLTRPRTNTNPDAITPVQRRDTLEVPADPHRSPKLVQHQGWA
ncbi:hypothetical protein E8E13_007923 [Curvularia kusanoi]|uniref:Uncharacterized protein n=1 Tax=Curvularia kusanoi TaxID=90978 RepID=A0A9P4TE27_CURKU|nr:hypothetical protein E8E13_007923 [Curvularia kusanoi]